jgi:two-component sensor histidine kinase
LAAILERHPKVEGVLFDQAAVAPIDRCRIVGGSFFESVPRRARQLLVSELVTNSVRHSGAGPEDAVIVGVGLSPALVRLEVEDRGGGGVIAPRTPDEGAGFGLRLVQTISERWGLERIAAGPSLVWAQLLSRP